MTSTTDGQTYARRGQKFLGGMRNVLLILGMVTLAYVAYVLLHGRFYQQQANDTLDQEIRGGGRSATNFLGRKVKEGDVLGRISIPRIGVTVAILQGTKSKTLRLGVGHVQGTPLLGEIGNVGIAGHRDT